MMHSELTELLHHVRDVLSYAAAEGDTALDTLRKIDGLLCSALDGHAPDSDDSPDGDV